MTAPKVSDQVAALEREVASLKERLRVANSGPEFTRDQVREIAYEVEKHLSLARKGEPGHQRRLQIAVNERTSAVRLGEEMSPMAYMPPFRVIELRW